MPVLPSLADLCLRIDALVRRRPGKRIIIGIVGAPGAGKTTLAEAVVDSVLSWQADWTAPVGDPAAVGSQVDGRKWVGSHVAHVPMDGFHLADVELNRLGRIDRKGAPDTFDAFGYAALLGRLSNAAEAVWAPGFDRSLEQPIAGSIPVLPDTRVIITEGNYLLLDEPAWRGARECMDEVWFCDLEGEIRRARLVARHVRFGKTPAAALDWATGPDQRNAELIEATRSHANLIVRETQALAGGPQLG